MTLTILESGLEFGPFDAESLFHIEKSESYKQRQENVKIAEFLWIQSTQQPQTKLWIVEAKTSVPKPDTVEYESFFAEISSKLANALAFTVSGFLNRNTQTRNELPTLFTQLDWANTDIKLALVIPNIPNQFLPPINDKFKKHLRSLTNIWSISSLSVVVLNTEKAIKYGLSSIH